MLSDNWKISSNNSNNITMTKKDVTMNRNWQIKTCDCWVCGLEIPPAKIIFAAFLTSDKCKHYVNTNNVHGLLGYPSEATTRKTAKEVRVTLTGQIKPCKACSLARARNKNVSKTPVEHSSIVRERLFIDISSPTVTGLGGKCHSFLIVCGKFEYICSFFLKVKSAW